MCKEPKATLKELIPPKGGSSVRQYSQCCGRCERLAVLHKGEVILPREEYDKLMQSIPAKAERTTININVGKINETEIDVDAIAKQIVKAIHERAKRGDSIV